jgi:long-chain acyl-CoA synthetase
MAGYWQRPEETASVICAAVGIKDERSGEAVKLYVARSDPTLDEEGVASYRRDNFTAYKRPRYIEFRDELPKSNVGKILRRKLRTNI